MGVVFSGMFGFGLVLFTKVETDQHLNHILFGNVLGVTVRDLVETAIIAGGTLLIVLLKRRDLLLYCFDPNHARAIGLPVRVLHYGLLVLLALTIVASLKAVGIILVIAMLIAPGAIAYLLTDRFDRMLADRGRGGDRARPRSARSSASTSTAPPAPASCWCRRRLHARLPVRAEARACLLPGAGRTVAPSLAPQRYEKPRSPGGSIAVADGPGGQNREDQRRRPADQHDAVQRRHRARAAASAATGSTSP